MSYFSTRLFSESATNRLPECSTATPSGAHKSPALLASMPLESILMSKLHTFEVKSPPCPKTMSAVGSVVSGALYTSTLWLLVSAT